MAPKCKPSRSPPHRPDDGFRAEGRLGVGGAGQVIRGACRIEAGGGLRWREGCVLGSGRGWSKGKREIQKKGACWGSSGLWEWRTGGSGVFSVLRDGPWKVLTCCGLLIFDRAASCRFLCPCQAPPHAAPSPRWAGGLGEGERERVATWQVSGRFSRWPPEGARGTAEFWGAGWGGEVAFVLLLEGVGRGISWRVLGAST